MPFWDIFFSCKLYSIQFLNAKMAFFKLFGIIENSKDADICICLVKQIACSISTPYWLSVVAKKSKSARQQFKSNCN